MLFPSLLEFSVSLEFIGKFTILYNISSNKINSIKSGGKFTSVSNLNLGIMADETSKDGSFEREVKFE